MSNEQTVSVVIVSYRSEMVLPRCLLALSMQSRQANRIVVVDSNSPDQGYLERLGPTVQVMRNKFNVGFCRGNNIGVRACSDSDYILFLNPDAFLSSTFIADALNWMRRPENSRVAILTGTLLGFDIELGRPNNRIDSTGLFQNWYGRWYDRDQGMLLEEASERLGSEDVPAACGALMFCRVKALQDALLREGEVFDERFFMYKEDIDLSLRVARKGWRVSFVPNFICWHGRGWRERGSAPLWAKRISARNELRICMRNRGRGMLFSSAKYAYVHTIESWFESKNGESIATSSPNE
jgi:N-acetylglucosaminyl-diphospho-decaprenol L-rhamnosyltransferase